MKQTRRRTPPAEKKPKGVAKTSKRKQKSPSKRAITGHRRRANPGASENAALNRKRAFDLRLQGKNYRQIAAALGVSVKTAFTYVDGLWSELEADTHQTAEKVRAMELLQLDELESVWMPIALSDNLDVHKIIDSKQGEPIKISMEAYEAGLKAVDRVLKIKERRAKLLGLEAPQKVEHSGHLTLDEFEARVKAAALN